MQEIKLTNITSLKCPKCNSKLVKIAEEGMLIRQVSCVYVSTNRKDIKIKCVKCKNFIDI